MAVFSGIRRLFGAVKPGGPKTLTAPAPGAATPIGTPPASMTPPNTGLAAGAAAGAALAAGNKVRRRLASADKAAYSTQPTGTILNPVMQPKTLLGA